MKLNIQLYGGRGASSSLYQQLEELRKERTRLLRSRGAKRNTYLKASFQFNQTRSEEDRLKVQSISKELQDIKNRLNKVNDKIDDLSNKEWKKAMGNLKKATK